MPSAYQSRPYDRGGHTMRMSDLIARQGQARATSALQQGDAAAQRWQHLGQTASGLMMDLASYADAAPQRDEAKRQQAEQAQQREKASKIEAIMKESVDPTTGRLKYDEAARKIAEFAPLDAEQFWAKADADKAETVKRDAERAREVAKRLAGVMAFAERDQAAGPGALQSATMEYRRIRQGAIKDGLITNEDLPEEFDPHVVENEIVQAMTADQVFQRLWAKKPGGEPYTLGPGQKRFGPNGQVLAEVPPVVRENAPAAGSLEDYIRAKRMENGDKPLTAAQIRQARAEYTAAGRAPESPRPGNTTNANTLRDDLRAAEQWKARELARIEAEFKETGDVDALNAAKARTQESYLVQIGAPPSTMGDLVKPKNTVPAAAPAPPPRAPSSPLGAGRAAAATPARPGMVRMRAPNGEIGFVPEAQVDAAIRAGATVVK